MLKKLFLVGLCCVFILTGCVSAPKPLTSYWRYFNWWHDNSELLMVRVLLTSDLDRDYQALKADISPTKILQGNYSKYLQQLPGDSAISSIARQLRLIAQRKGYSEEKLADLAAGFIQKAIAYDHEEFTKLNQLKNTPIRETIMTYRTPYQVLWFGKAVSIDKSFLGYALMKELGFGTALISLPENHHVAFAIQCSKGLTAHNGCNYAFIESTTQRPIGVQPLIINQRNVSRNSVIIPTIGKKYW